MVVKKKNARIWKLAIACLLFLMSDLFIFFSINKLQNFSQLILLFFSFKSLLLRRNKNKKKEDIHTMREHAYKYITRPKNRKKKDKYKVGKRDKRNMGSIMYFLSSIENTVLIRLKNLVLCFFSNRCNIKQEKLSASSWKIEIKKVVTKKKHVITLG